MNYVSNNNNNNNNISNNNNDSNYNNNLNTGLLPILLGSNCREVSWALGKISPQIHSRWTTTTTAITTTTTIVTTIKTTTTISILGYYLFSWDQISEQSLELPAKFLAKYTVNEQHQQQQQQHNNNNINIGLLPVFFGSNCRKVSWALGKISCQIHSK